MGQGVPRLPRASARRGTPSGCHPGAGGRAAPSPLRAPSEPVSPTHPWPSPATPTSPLIQPHVRGDTGPAARPDGPAARGAASAAPLSHAAPLARRQELAAGAPWSHASDEPCHFSRPAVGTRTKRAAPSPYGQRQRDSPPAAPSRVEVGARTAAPAALCTPLRSLPLPSASSALHLVRPPHPLRSFAARPPLLAGHALPRLPYSAPHCRSCGPAGRAASAATTGAPPPPPPATHLKSHPLPHPSPLVFSRHPPTSKADLRVRSTTTHPPLRA